MQRTIRLLIVVLGCWRITAFNTTAMAVTGSGALSSAGARFDFVPRIEDHSFSAENSHRASYLNPNTGRFWTMDTYQGNQEDPLSLHKYLYCYANPVNYVDPSGFDGFDVVGSLMNVNILSALSQMPSVVSDSTIAWSWLTATIDVVRVYAERLGLGQDNTERDFSRANEIYTQAHIKLEVGKKKTIDVEDAIHLIGPDLLLNVRNGVSQPPTSEETALTQGQSKQNFTVYYVGGFEGKPSLGGRAADPAVYVRYSAPSDVLAHELGHILLRTFLHEDDIDNLMAEGDKSTGKDLLTQQQCILMRAYLQQKN